MIAPLARRRSRAGPSAGIWRATSRGDRACEPRARRDEDRPGVRIVLGLREEVGGDPRRPAVCRDDRGSRSVPRRSRWRIAPKPAPSRRPRRRCRARRSCPPEGWSRCQKPARRWRGRRRGGAAGRCRPRAPRSITVGSGFGQTAMISLHAGDARGNGRHQERRGKWIAAAGHVAADAIERETRCSMRPRQRADTSSRAAPAAGRPVPMFRAAARDGAPDVGFRYARAPHRSPPP